MAEFSWIQLSYNKEYMAEKEDIRDDPKSVLSDFNRVNNIKQPSVYLDWLKAGRPALKKKMQEYRQKRRQADLMAKEAFFKPKKQKKDVSVFDFLETECEEISYEESDMEDYDDPIMEDHKYDHTKDDFNPEERTNKRIEEEDQVQPSIEEFQEIDQAVQEAIEEEESEEEYQIGEANKFKKTDKMVLTIPDCKMPMYKLLKEKILIVHS